MPRPKGSKNGVVGKAIDQKQFEKLCSMLCTEIEIAGYFGVTHDTVNAWCKKTYKKTFEEAFAELSVLGKISLRRYQFQQAETNPTMAIWLGKQILGQRDIKDEPYTGEQITIINDVPETKVASKEKLGNGK